jgi:hypothetical protein
VADEQEREDPYAASDALIDESLAAGDPTATEPSRPVDRFRRTSAGAVVAAGLFGLRDALEGRPEQEEVAIVVDAPARAVDDPIDVQLDFDDPGSSRVVVRRPPTQPS